MSLGQYTQISPCGLYLLHAHAYYRSYSILLGNCGFSFFLRIMDFTKKIQNILTRHCEHRRAVVKIKEFILCGLKLNLTPPPLVYFFVYFFFSNINYLQTKAMNNSWLKSAIIFIYEILKL